MNEALFAQTSFVILSAGSSVRMGTHKALLKYDADTTFIQKIVETVLCSGIEQVVVVVNSELFEMISESAPSFSKQVKLVVNDKPELGRFYSLQTGIKHLKPGNYCIFQSIDNPFTSEVLLGELILHKSEADIIIPTFQNQSGHPVLISSSVIEEILKVWDSDLRIDLFLKRFGIKKIETSDPNILVNINYPADYDKTGSSI